MLSLFPELLFLAPFSAFLMRLAIGIAFGYTAWKHLSLSREAGIQSLAVVEVALAIALIAGFLTQAAAIVSGLLLTAWFFTSLRPLPKSTILLLLVMCISLLITGAGPFAFDLPL